MEDGSSSNDAKADETDCDPEDGETIPCGKGAAVSERYRGDCHCNRCRKRRGASSKMDNR